MDYQVLKKAVMNVSNLEVETDDGTKKYKLALDMNAIANANETLGKDFALPQTWVGMTAVETAKLCWYALKRFHPNIMLDEVFAWFTPEHAPTLHNLLFELAFPGVLERLKKAAEENKAPGKDQPSTQPQES